MKLADLFVRCRQELEDKYGSRILPEQRRAMESIVRCRNDGSATTLMVCPDCNTTFWHRHSCSHRSCPQCQHPSSTTWLNRQMSKLLPVRYYLLTFTLPSELRHKAYCHQIIFYEALFTAGIETVRSVAGNPIYLGAEPGMTAVLHTHSRRLEIHPHIHIIMRGGGLDRKKGLWIQGTRKYLFPKDVLKELFREKYLACLRDAGIQYPHHLHEMKWVIRIKAAGTGEPALKYLSKYLYRGVIQERNILSDTKGEITFEYEESATKSRKTRTMPAVDFLFLILKHVLPKRFRRSRDYGFLHGNARKSLHRIQLLLHCNPPQALEPEPWRVLCPSCGHKMIAVGFIPSVSQKSTYAVRNRGSPVISALKL
jgi:hypothetical protein